MLIRHSKLFKKFLLFLLFIISFINCTKFSRAEDYKTLEFKASNETLKATDSRLFLKWKKPRHCITDPNILKHRNSNESLELNRKTLKFRKFSKMEN